MVRAVEEFKTSSEMRDLKVQFGQAAFIKGFELCQEKMVGKFLELNLGFLDEASDDEARPSEAAASLPPVGTSSTIAATAVDLPGVSSSFTSASECPTEALSRPQGIPLKSMIRDLRRKVHHLMKKSKKLDDELHRLRKSHSKATTEVTRLRDLHKKDFMDYTRKKADFIKELAKNAPATDLGLRLPRSAPLRSSWRLHGRRSASWRRAHPGLQPRPTTIGTGQKILRPPEAVANAKANYNAYRVSWCG
ncbi:uncharacterized protein [Elaeis guineensis]|uniref:uncharacterized protein n=1 Tax=Elaeis guineensis var. tenera TaxID=51953 RepID=UPI003C6D9C43